MPHLDQADRSGGRAWDLFVRGGRDGRLLWASPSWSRLGLAPAELVGRSLAHAASPDDLPALREALARIAAGEEVSGVRLALEDHRLEWNLTPDEDGFLGVACESPVLHGQAEYIQQLSLVEQVSRTGHWFVDLERDEVTWSPEVYRIHGRPPSFVPTMESGIQSYHPDDRDRVAQCVEAAVSAKAPFEFVLRLVRPDGEVRVVQSLGRPQLDASDRVVGIFGVFRDITDDDHQRRHEELELFAHAISHDMREPARTVSSYLGLLLRGVELDERQQRYATYVMQASERMGKHLDALLAYAKAGVRFHLVSCEVVSILEEVGRYLAIEEGALLLPEGRWWVRGHEAVLFQVFMNLLQNARKYSGASRPLRVEVSIERDGGRVAIALRDQGIGFDPVFAKDIFLPFRSLAPDGVGTGMGLALVARMLAQCGGFVDAQGTPGAGATFTVRLDGAEAPDDLQAARADRRRLPT